MQEGDHCSEEAPNINIHTIGLRHPYRVQCLHNRLSYRIPKEPGFHVHRLHANLQVYPRLEVLRQHIISVDDPILTIRGNGASLFYSRTTVEPDIGVPLDRASIVYFLCADSPKAQYLSRLVSRLIFTQKRKLVVFIESLDIILWYLQMILTHLGINLEILQTSMDIQHRLAAGRNFCHPGSRVQLLLVTYLTSNRPQFARRVVRCRLVRVLRHRYYATCNRARLPTRTNQRVKTAALLAHDPHPWLFFC
jgi:hypothetical protein